MNYWNFCIASLMATMLAVSAAAQDDVDYQNSDEASINVDDGASQEAGLKRMFAKYAGKGKGKEKKDKWTAPSWLEKETKRYEKPRAAAHPMLDWYDFDDDGIYNRDR